MMYVFFVKSNINKKNIAAGVTLGPERIVSSPYGDHKKSDEKP